MENHILSPIERLEQTLYDLSDSFRKHHEYIKMKYKVSAIELEIVLFVILQGRKKMKEIGQHFNIKLSTLTSVIDKLERRKFIKRVNSKEDRRVVYLVATTKGQKLYEKYTNYLSVVGLQMKREMQDDFGKFVSGIEKVASIGF